MHLCEAAAGTIMCALFAGWTGAAAGCSESAAEEPEQQQATTRSQDESPIPVPDDVDRQFDFWLGQWDVQNQHLQSSGQWKDTGKARATIQSIAGGNAVLEQWDGNAPAPLHGFSVRTYDQSLGKWVIVLNWHGGQPSGFSQMHGSFSSDRGEFFPPGDGPHGVRFTFSKARPSSCQWDQAVRRAGSDDWTTNWIMSFTRSEKHTAANATTVKIATPPDSSKRFPRSRELDAVIGFWKGSASRLTDDGSWQDGEVTAAACSMIRGLGLMCFADFSWDQHAFAAMAFDPQRLAWVRVGVDNTSDGFSWRSGNLGDDAITWTDMQLGATTITRQTWSGFSAATMTLLGEVSTDAGESWKPVLRATLERQAGR